MIQSIHRGATIGYILALLALWLIGCVGGTAGPTAAGRDAVDESALIRADVTGIESDVSAIRTEVGSVGAAGTIGSELTAIKTTVGDIQTGGDLNDTWTLRLLVIGIVTGPLWSYILPKLLWRHIEKLKQKNGELRAQRLRDGFDG